MLVAYVASDGALRPHVIESGGSAPGTAVWFDLLSPSPEDEAIVERAVGIEVPTREEMQEIEPSSRLYVEAGARYMTLSMLCDADTDRPFLTPVTFVLVNSTLVTVRYAQPKSFTLLAGRLQKACPLHLSGDVLLHELLEAVIDRTADILEHCASGIERLSRSLFERDGDGRGNDRKYRAILTHIGRKEGLTSYARESLASLSRMISFLGAEGEGAQVGPELKRNLKSMSRDVSGLADYANFLANKLQFLLDGTIGMVGLEQNNIIKIFAVLSVVFLPPTLIASIYGMNFTHMPELQFALGYPLALVSMVASAILPYVFFKWRGWL